MPLESDEAIVLGRLDYSETSQVLVLFTRSHGKMRLIAKGIKRSTRTRFAVAIDLLEHGHVVFSQRSDPRDTLGILTEWKAGAGWAGLRRSLVRLYAAQYACEVLAALTQDGDRDEPLFETLKRFLEQAASSDDMAWPLFDFLRTLLSQLGFLPRFDGCVCCEKPVPLPEPVHFSSWNGGLLCRDCEGSHVEKGEISSETLAVLMGREKSPRGTVGAVTLFNYHVSHLMGRPPKVGKALLEQLRRADRQAI